MRMAGDERVVSITEPGEMWLRQHHQGIRAEPDGEASEGGC